MQAAAFTKDFNKILSDLHAYDRGVSSPDHKPIVDRLNALKNAKKTYSDVISKGDGDEELQWVNFVQEGGGTLGIALAGYAFVLEFVGIRFLKLAGTSAGAINTLFLAAIGEKNDPKTPELYNMLTDPKRLDLKSFVDAGNGLVRQLLFSLGKGMGLLSNLAVGFIVLLLLVLLPLPFISHIGVEGKLAYFFMLGIFLTITVIIFILLKRLARFNLGINPGVKFTEFLAKELNNQGIRTKSDLDKKAKGEGIFSLPAWGQHNIGPATATLQTEATDLATTNSNTITVALREQIDVQEEKSKEAYKHIGFDYHFVSTDICNQCKMVFPADADLYFDAVDEVSPAHFVRASMAIPIFFEPQFFPLSNSGKDNSQKISAACKQKWGARKGIEAAQVEQKGILIDGGSLSNFPINLFHIPAIKKPRIPIMGVRILDAKPATSYNHSKGLSLSYYIGNIINTLRNNEDSSFLAANPFYKRFCIAEIKAYETKVNWLNFDLSKKEKEALFVKGIETALNFLESFDWEEYKKERAKI